MDRLTQLREYMEKKDWMRFILQSRRMYVVSADLRGKTHSFLSQRRISILSLMQDTQSRHLMNVRITNL